MSVPDPDDVDLQINLCTTCLKHDQYADALSTLDAVIQKEPKNAVALLYRIQANSLLNREHEVMKDLLAFWEIQPAWFKNGANKSGFLSKKFESKQYRHYYVYLRGRLLVWYKTDRLPTDKNDKEAQPQGGIYLGDFTVRSEEPKRFTITIAGGASVHSFETDTTEEKGSWVKALEDTGKTRKATIYGVTLQPYPKKKSERRDWINKQGGQRSANFKKRWCVLKGNFFYYYERQEDLTPNGVWDLAGNTVQRYSKDDGMRFKW